MKVSIFGLGYVGAVAAACLADSGFDVIATDTDPVKIRCLQQGCSPIIEPGLADLVKKGVVSGKLSAVADARVAVMNSDISLICVGTPSDGRGGLRLDYVETVCGEIGAVLRHKKEFHSVVLRSTVVPGTGCHVVIPALERASGKKAGIDFGFGNNPEFMRESSAIFDYFNPPKIVIGALDAQTTNALSLLYKGIDAPLVATSIEVAEGVKYADNAWHAMKVGFANELGNILKEHDVDSHKVMDIFFLDTKLNISRAYLKPGFAFGGSCLPKDVRALCVSAQERGLKTPLFDALLAANEEQICRAHAMVRRSGKKKVGMMGLSFKAGSDDLRGSPLVTLAERLLRDGMDLAIYDPCVYEAANREGAGRTYIRDGIPHIADCLVSAPDDLLQRAELLVIGNHGEDYAGILTQANDNVPIIDLVRLREKVAESRRGYSGICW